MAWDHDAWYCAYLEYEKPPSSARNILKQPFREGNPSLWVIFLMFLHCNTHRQNSNYWQFWACRNIWWCAGMVIECSECLFSYRCPIIAWGIAWIFMFSPSLSPPTALSLCLCPWTRWSTSLALSRSAGCSFRSFFPFIQLLYNTLMGKLPNWRPWYKGKRFRKEQSG